MPLKREPTHKEVFPSGRPSMSLIGATLVSNAWPSPEGASEFPPVHLFELNFMALLDWVKRLRPTAGSADGAARPAGARPGAAEAKETDDLEGAFKRHRGQDLDGAEKIYRKLLQEHPENVGALHLLGTLYGQKGDPEQAAKYLERAAELSPGDPNILADLARVRAMEGRLEAAESLLRSAVNLAPGEAGHHFALARILIRRGDAGRAVDSLSRAVQLNPEFVEAYSDLGAVCLELGRYGPAKDALASAVRLDAGCVPACLNLAHLHSLFGAYDQAASQCRAILDTDPANDQALTRLATVYALSGEDQKALRCYEQLASLFPGRTELWNQQGCMAQKLGLHSKAAGCFERSLDLEANQPETLTNLGIVYALAGKLTQSAACFESAVALRSDLASAYHNLGATYLQQGRQDEALVAYEKALNLAPQSSVTLSNVIAINNYRRRGDSRYMADLFHRYLASLAPERVIATIPANHDRTRRRRLKIGYVSPNFHQHSVSYFIEPAIAGHDRQRFEVFCYADVAKPDGNTERLESAADRWRNICGKSHDAVAALIRRDRIDILIDLAGHSADNRLPVFARKPAPVQISYLGYPGTTGLPEIDYRLTDAVADPPGEPEGAYTEKLVRFPRVFLCYEPPDPAPPVSALQHPRGSVCFGSFNELPKISPEVVRTWSAILARVPGSTLLLKARAFADEGTCARVIGWFHDAGIERERVELLARTPTVEAHLALYARVDIALDTFPYNGTTTTCEALYMGVPVVTLLGDVHASRVGASLLTATGLNSLIAGSEDAYIRRAVSLAENLPERTRMRETIRGRLLASPLADKRAFLDSLESIYLDAWETWCDGGAPSNVQAAPSQNRPAGEIAGAIRLNTVDSYPIWLPGDLN
ncbi:MAG TPA: tetratricopeptide repeat protein, partial [Gammaproteobacteria bacterium]